jgi:hypothetical protein
METASPMASQEPHPTSEQTEDLLQGLKAYSTLFEKLQKISHLLERTEHYQSSVPREIYTMVRDDYQKRKNEIDKGLTETLRSGITGAPAQQVVPKATTMQMFQQL